MKKLIGIALCFIGFHAFAQQETAAKRILDQVSKRYDAYQTVQSEFSFSAKQANGEAYSDKGLLFMNKPKKQYKIQLERQDLISDGKSTWSILKEEKEVQISEADNSTDAIGPNNIFTFYKTGFKYKSLADEQNKSEALKVIELTPIDATKNYAKIKLRVNRNSHIHDVSIFDKSGAIYTYLIEGLYVNTAIADKTFQFDAKNYSTFELVDLR